MSVITIDDLRSRSIIDPITRCWHWQGAKEDRGVPRIWTIDYERMTKRVMGGPLAVWHIAHNQAPGWGLIFRSCFTTDCVCPAHHKQARNKAEIMNAARMCGAASRWVGDGEQRRKALMRAREAAGVFETPSDTVLKVRDLLAAGHTGRHTAQQLGIGEQVVSRIKRDKRWERFEQVEAVAA